MSLNVTINASIGGEYRKATDRGEARYPIPPSDPIVLRSGTGAGKADIFFDDERTLASNTSENLDLAGALADAKLEWVGSANLIENFPELALTPEQRAVTQRLDDPLLRGLVKAMCLDRALRHDVFVRGARRIDPTARDAALMDVCLALDVSAAEVPHEAEVPAGRVAREAFILGPSLTGVLARMERDGLITRSRDPNDQRCTVIEATPHGRKLVKRLSVSIEAHYKWMEESLGKEKLTHLYALLDELIALEQP